MRTSRDLSSERTTSNQNINKKLLKLLATVPKLRLERGPWYLQFNPTLKCLPYIWNSLKVCWKSCNDNSILFRLPYYKLTSDGRPLRFFITSLFPRHKVEILSYIIINYVVHLTQFGCAPSASKFKLG